MVNVLGDGATATAGKITADPTKEFFVGMITRDIALHDCIFDLLDNSIDGARRTKRGNEATELAGFRVEISFSSEHFCIKDNCGGIRLSDAVEYAFRFGRAAGKPDDVSGGIGLYGIGMKRAIFKIGRIARVLSETSKERFSVAVNVDEWLTQKPWDFEYSVEQPTGEAGTSIEIGSILPGVAEVFGDASFSRELANLIARDYAFFIARGLQVTVCGHPVANRKYELQTGNELAPAVMQYEDRGVEVRLIAGLIEPLEDDVPDEIRADKVNRFGWYVVCNDRVVLAADKSNRTVWGDDQFPAWHYQYNGFAGFAFFRAADQGLLPWTTTKRDLDAESAVYRRAVVKMKELTRTFIDYTNARRGDKEAAKIAEVVASKVDISSLHANQDAVLPRLPAQARGRRTVTISYVKPVAEVEEMKDHLGDPSLSARDIGRITYDYFREAEMGK